MMNSLTTEQLKAIESFNEHALRFKDESKATIRHILKMSNISEDQYVCALKKLNSHSRVDIHFHPDRYDGGGKFVVNSLLESGVYKNQFETKISNGSVSAHPGGPRDEWERVLYNGAYHSGGFLDSCRPKYGALDIFHHPDGPAPRFGSCYFVLKNEVLNRSTFTYLDSHQLPSERGTLEEFDSILCSLLTEIFTRNYALGEHQLSVTKFFDFLLNKIDVPLKNYEREIPRINLDHYIEAQIHGEISLQNDVECLISDPSFISTNIDYLRSLNSVVLDFFGKVAIRVSYDKLNEVHHAYFPAFIIPKIHITTYDLQFILTTFWECFSLGITQEALINCQDREYFDYPSSSLHWLLIWFLRFANAYLDVPVEKYSLSSYKKIDQNSWEKFIDYLNARGSPK